MVHRPSSMVYRPSSGPYRPLSKFKFEKLEIYHLSLVYYYLISFPVPELIIITGLTVNTIMETLVLDTSLEHVIYLILFPAPEMNDIFSCRHQFPGIDEFGC